MASVRMIRNCIIRRHLLMGIAILTGFACTACNASVGVGAQYHPVDSPVVFSADFTVQPDGQISFSGSAGIVTEIGVFSISANFTTSANPTDSETLLIIRHHLRDGIVDSVYRIATGEAIIVTVNGKNTIYVSDRKVLIDASKGTVQRLVVRNAPGARPTPKPTEHPAGSVWLDRVIKVPGMEIYTLSWSPDGRLIAASGETANGSKLNDAVSETFRATDGHLVTKHAESDWTMGGISWSPNGKLIASTAYSIDIWQASTGANVATLADGREANTASWSPDSKFVVESAPQYGPTVWSVDGSSEVCEFPSQNLWGEEVQWSPKTDLIASDGVVFSGSSCKGVSSFANGADLLSDSAWAPNGYELASFEEETIAVYLTTWDARTGAQIWRHNIGSVNTGAQISWSPSGRYLAYSDGAGSAFVVDATTGSILRDIGANYLGTAGEIDALSWSPDGRYIATASNGVIQLWQTSRW